MKFEFLNYARNPMRLKTIEAKTLTEAREKVFAELKEYFPDKYAGFEFYQRGNGEAKFLVVLSEGGRRRKVVASLDLKQDNEKNDKAA